ncbi:MAG: rRNA maturation RNase YbeY [Filomicrobium sp.]
MNDDSDSCHSATSQDPPKPAVAGEVTVDVLIEAGDWSSFADIENFVIIAAQAAARFPEAGLAGGQAAIALSNDAQVATLNADFRGKPAPTNVLSFPAPKGLPTEEGEGRFLGDIILAAETLDREAADLGIPPKHHLQHLVVHGLLHLAGFDHIEEEDAQEMEALETRILATLNIPDPYTHPMDEVKA